MGRKIFYALCLAWIVPLAQAITISNLVVNDLTKSAARITWDTDAPTHDEIFYGPTSSYGWITLRAPGYDARIHHTWFISGLAANTLYHFCPGDADGITVCNGAQNDYTLTTASEASAQPSAAAPPSITVDTTLPVQAGRTLSVLADFGCSDATLGLQAQIDAAQAGDTIVIPAGAKCTGQFRFPNKSGNGWIVIRTSTPDNQLPQENTRMVPGFAPLLAMIRASGIRGPNQIPSPSGACKGGLDWAYNTAQPFSLYQCQANDAWGGPVPTTTGTQVPTTCNVGDWFMKTPFNSTDFYTQYTRTAWWCLEPDTYAPVNLQTISDGSATAAIDLMPGAHHYRFIGIDVTHIPTPGVVPGTAFWNLVFSGPSNHHITFDRCYIHGLDYPTRVNFAFNFNGANMALIDSTIDKINFWIPNPNYTEYMGNAINFGTGPGPTKIVNNYIGAIGFGFFIPDDTSLGPFPQDVEVRRNYFFMDDKYRPGSPASDGHLYFKRNIFELKQGRRIWVEGNIFENDWVGDTASAAIAIAPRISAPSSGVPIDNDVQIADITFTKNIFRHLFTGLSISARAQSQGDFGMSRNTERFTLTHNLFDRLDGFNVSNISPFAVGAIGAAFIFFSGDEDVTVAHNTMLQGQGTNPYFIFMGNDPSNMAPNANLIVRDNVAASVSPGGMVNDSGSLYGKAALDATWKRLPNPAWWMDHNLFFGPTPTYAQPAGNFWAADPNAASSTYKGQASDGTDPGVDSIALQAATEHTMDGQWGGPPPPLPTPTSVPPTPPNPVTASGLAAVRIYPNPWRADKHASKKIVFDGLSSGSTIKLFTTSGHRVKELHTDGPSTFWNLANDSGDKVSSGLYVYVITDAQGNKMKGKLAVIK